MFVSGSCISKQLWTLFILEERIEPFLLHGIYRNAIFSSFQFHLNWSPCLRVYLSTVNIIISSSLFAHWCHILNVISFPVCFYFSPVGSRVDASNKIEWETSTINTYPSMRKSRRTLDVYSIGYQQTRQAAPLWTYGFKVFQNLLFFNIRFNYLLSIGRVNLSNACSILVA
jgi:hypothetical protein